MPDPLDALQPTERFLQAVVPMALLSLDGAVLHVNDAACRLAGRPRQDLVGRSAAGAVAPEDQGRVRTALAAGSDGKPGGELDVAVLTPDGTERLLSAVWSLVRDPEGTPAYLTVVLFDVSDSRRRHDHLLRTADRYRARFAQSSVPQAMIGLDGTLLEVNDALCALLGRDAHAFVGTVAADDLHPQDDGSGEAPRRRLLSGEVDNARFERVLRDGEGRPVPVLVDLTLVRGSDGEPTEAAAIFYDLRTLRDAERRRDQQEQFFLAVSQRASDVALVADADGQLLFASAATHCVAGYEPGELVTRLGWDFVHPDDLARAQAAYQGVVSAGGSDTFVLRVRMADGSWRWFEETVTNMLDSAVGGIVANLRDIHDRVEAERALTAAEARYRAIAETAEEGIWAVDDDGATLFANARMAAILGLPLEQVHASRPDELLPPDAAAEVAQRTADRARRGAERYEIGYLHPDGESRRLWIAASPLPGAGSLAMISDVTETRRAEEQLRRAALHDDLTGLANRTLLLDRLEGVLARQQAGPGATGAAVLLVDLDDFRLVNDSKGHGVGDSLLLAVGQRLRAAARPADTVARLGADAFVVVCEDVPATRTRDLARGLLAAFDEPFEVEGHLLHVSAAVGVASTPACSGDDLLRFADTALVAAKAEGPGAVVLFDREHAERVEQRYALAADLRAALERDEVSLHYQPVVDLDSGRVSGVEALARWQHPQHGAVPPSRFVEVAERTGLVVTLDCWALERAVRETADLRRRGVLGPEVSVAVNLSARTVAAPELEALVDRVLASSGTPARLLVLEITESAVMQDAELAVRVLTRLRARGVGVAVDDFGTGYSSLAYLRDLPLTSLKVDRSFVATIAEDRDALAIVASVVDLGRAVGVTVVAEGVETVEQAELLAGLGCRRAQGWLWSPALSVDQVESVAGTWAAGFLVRQARAPRVAPKQGRRWEAGPEHGAERLLDLHGQGASLTTIAAALNSEGYRTPTGARWHRTTVARTVADAAYPALRA